VPPCYCLWRPCTSFLQSVAPPQEVTDGGGIVLSSFRINNGYLPSRLTLIVNQSQFTRHSVRGGTSQFLYFMTTKGGGVWRLRGCHVYAFTLPCTVPRVVVALEVLGNFPLFVCVRLAFVSPLQQSSYYSYHQWRNKGGCFRGFKSPWNSEGPPKSCQTQPDCENC